MKNPKRISKIKKIKRIRKWKIRSLVVLCTIVFLIVLLFTFIYTSLGIKVISRVLEKVVPEVHIGHVTGALNNLEIDDFSFTMNGVDVSVGKSKLSLSGLCLIEGKICIKNFEAQDVSVNINTANISSGDDEVTHSEPELKSTERFVLKTPLPIELRSAILNNVNVNVDQMHFGLSNFQGRATWINELIYVSPTTAMDVKAIFPDTIDDPHLVTKEKQSPQAINEIIEDLFNKPLISSLPTVNIPLDFHVSHLTGAGWQLHMGGEDYFFNDVVIEANTNNNLIEARLVETDAKSNYGNGHIQVKGHIKLGEQWPINATINGKTDGKKFTELNSQFDGQLLGVLSNQTNIKGNNQAKILAKINFSEKYLPITTKINGKHLQWPLEGKADYQLNDFSIDLSGLVNHYNFNAEGNLFSKELSKAYFNVQSDGTNEYLNIKNANVTLPQGGFSLLGKINWLNKLRWDSEIKFKQLDLTQWLPTYPIKLDGQLVTHGIYDERSWAINLNNVDLTGDINYAPLQMNGDVSVNSNQYVSANNFNVNWGNNIIKLNGSTKKEDLVADINFSNLNIFDSKMSGNIIGHFIANGALEHPTVNADIKVNKLLWQDISLDQATLNGKVSYHDIVSGDITLKVKRLVTNSLTINNTNIVLSGNEQKHNLTLNMVGKPLSNQMVLEGSLNKKRSEWQGSIPQAIVMLGHKNDWKINNPIKLNYNITRNLAQISAHCWLNNKSQICLDNDVIFANKGKATVSLNNIDLGLANSLINNQTNMAGYIDGKININWDPKFKIPDITAYLDGKNVYIKQQIASQTLPIPFDLFKINADLNDKQANLSWKFGFSNLGKFSGNLRISDPVKEKRLSGQVDINNISLAMINPLLNGNEHANGFINSNLKFSGSLLDPYITGNFDLEHSEIKANQLPVDVRSIMLDIDFHGKSSDLKGIMKTKAGEININGKANWQNVDNWNANVSVKGQAISLNMAPLLTMQIIPDIRVTANQHQLDLDGQVTIPKASIKIESLPPSTIDVSSDEVILDDHLRTVKSQNYGMAINSHVLVSLGEDVTIDAYGLAANLQGKLFVTQGAKGTTVNGQINIPKGRFHAYGQDLIVRKGEIIFAGPADQPRLNIEAIRNQDSIDDNVTAGIRVTGLADEPKVEIFSNPTMSQQEALSYLLRGQGLNSDEQGDNDMFTALLIGLGTAQTSNLVGDIGNTFGIKNLSLDTQGVGNNQKVVVSGYLLPNLQLKYGVGIFDSLAIFTLRYRLLPRLYLDVASGLDQTVDLIYQFEF